MATQTEAYIIGGGGKIIRLEIVLKMKVLRSFYKARDFHHRAFQEGEVLRNLLISRLVSSTRNFDLERGFSSRFPALLTMALRREEAGVSVFHPVRPGQLYSQSLVPDACQSFSSGGGPARSGLGSSLSLPH